MAETTETEPTFKGGLVLAGAVSGGAYMAGVLDFILQALDTWEAEKNTNPDATPNHKFEICALSGASAGSISAAVFARMLATKTVPVHDVNNPPDQPVANPKDETVPFQNPLYATWVQSIDIRHLLKDEDLKDSKAELLSLLDSTVLPYIGSNVLNVTGMENRPRPGFISENLDVFFNSTNLRGVPYSLAFKGEVENYRHMMDVHGEYKHFSLNWNNFTGPGPHAIRLDPSEIAPSGVWGDFVSASIASGAFPVGLAPRMLSRKIDEYNIPPRPEELGTPDWPLGIKTAGPGYTYQYMNVDGGMVNNEPLELARRTLSGGKDIKNPRSGDEAKAAVIMVDPFPNTSAVKASYAPERNIFQVLGRLISIVLNQMRFKPEEIKLSLDDNVYSRFVVSPVYASNEQRIEPLAIYGELLGSFGAFLSESFRRHDFQLGRRNGQHFLRKYFVLPETNPLFSNWTEAMKAQYGVDRDGVRHLPVIPLVKETVTTEIPLPPRPRSSEVNMDELGKQLRARVKAVVPKLIAVIPNGILRTIAKLVWKLDWLIGISKIIAGGMVEKIADELKKINDAVLK